MTNSKYGLVVGYNFPDVKIDDNVLNHTEFSVVTEFYLSKHGYQGIVGIWRSGVAADSKFLLCIYPRQLYLMTIKEDHSGASGGTEDLKINRWYRAVVRIRDNDRAELWLDGKKKIEIALDKALNKDVGDNYKYLRIGNYVPKYSRFKGKLRYVKYYDKFLTDEEINDYFYNQTIPSEPYIDLDYRYGTVADLGRNNYYVANALSNAVTNTISKQGVNFDYHAHININKSLLQEYARDNYLIYVEFYPGGKDYVYQGLFTEYPREVLYYYHPVGIMSYYKDVNGEYHNITAYGTVNLSGMNRVIKTKKNEEYRLYVNGIKYNVLNYPYTPMSSADLSKIGRLGSSYDRTLFGGVRRVAIYDDWDDELINNLNKGNIIKDGRLLLFVDTYKGIHKSYVKYDDIKMRIERGVKSNHGFQGIHLTGSYGSYGYLALSLNQPVRIGRMIFEYENANRTANNFLAKMYRIGITGYLFVVGTNWLWIRDNNNDVHYKTMYPNGYPNTNQYTEVIFLDNKVLYRNDNGNYFEEFNYYNDFMFDNIQIGTRFWGIGYPINQEFYMKKVKIFDENNDLIIYFDFMNHGLEPVIGKDLISSITIHNRNGVSFINMKTRGV